MGDCCAQSICKFANLMSSYPFTGGGQHFQQDHNIPSATSLKHLPGHKISDLPGPPAHSAASAAASATSLAAKQQQQLQQQQKQSLEQQSAASSSEAQKEKDADAAGISQGLLDSIGALSKLPVWKPTSSTKSDNSQAEASGIYFHFATANKAKHAVQSYGSVRD